MSIQNLIKLANDFIKLSGELARSQEINEPVSEERLIQTVQSQNPLQNAITIEHLHNKAAHIINPNVGDELSEVHQLGARSFRFNIHTQTPNSFHLYRKLALLINTNYPTKHKQDTGEKLMFYYPDHAITLAMHGKEIRVQVLETHSETNKHKNTTVL